LWRGAAAAAILFFGVGVACLLRRRFRVELAQIAWVTPVLVCALNAPESVPWVWRAALGWAGFAGMALVLGIASVRLLREKDGQTPWYGIGAPAVMGLWAHIALPAQSAQIVLAVAAAVMALWTAEVVRHSRKKALKAWSGLFSICSAAALALSLGAVDVGGLFTALAFAVCAIDMRRSARSRLV
jgi:hypothetical protein